MRVWRWLVLAASLSLVSPAEAQDRVKTRREITRLTKCFTKEMGLEDWEIRVQTIFAPDTTWSGITRISFRRGDRPLAEITYELSYLSTYPSEIHPTVRHEMIHVVTGAPFVVLYQYDKDKALDMFEYVTQRIAAWRLWAKVCR